MVKKFLIPVAISLIVFVMLFLGPNSRRVHNAISKGGRDAASTPYYSSLPLGMNITGPQGWHMREGSLTDRMRVEFGYSPGFEPGSPTILVTMDKLSGGPAMLPDYVRNSVDSYTKKLGFQLISETQDSIIGDLRGYSFVVDSPKNKAGQSLRMSHYLYPHDDQVVLVLCTVTSSLFSRFSKDFDAGVKTLKLSPPISNDQVLNRFRSFQIKFIDTLPSDFEALKHALESEEQREPYTHTVYLLRDLKDQSTASRKYEMLSGEMLFNSTNSFEVSFNNYKAGQSDLWRIVNDDQYSYLGIWAPMPQGIPDFEQMRSARKRFYEGLVPGRYLDLLTRSQPQQSADNVLGQFLVLSAREKNTSFKMVVEPIEGALEIEHVIWIDRKDASIRYARSTVTGTDSRGAAIEQISELYFPPSSAPFNLGVPKSPYDQAAPRPPTEDTLKAKAR